MESTQSDKGLRLLLSKSISSPTISIDPGSTHLCSPFQLDGAISKDSDDSKFILADFSLLKSLRAERPWLLRVVRLLGCIANDPNDSPLLQWLYFCWFFVVVLIYTGFSVYVISDISVFNSIDQQLETSIVVNFSYIATLIEYCGSMVLLYWIQRRVNGTAVASDIELAQKCLVIPLITMLLLMLTYGGFIVWGIRSSYVSPLSNEATQKVYYPDCFLGWSVRNFVMCTGMWLYIIDAESSRFIVHRILYLAQRNSLSSELLLIGKKELRRRAESMHFPMSVYAFSNLIGSIAFLVRIYAYPSWSSLYVSFGFYFPAVISFLGIYWFVIRVNDKSRELVKELGNQLIVPLLDDGKRSSEHELQTTEIQRIRLYLIATSDRIALSILGSSNLDSLTFQLRGLGLIISVIVGLIRLAVKQSQSV